MSYLPNRFTLADGPQLDAFSGLIVSLQNTLFDSQQEYGLDTLRTWDCTANGTLPASNSTNGSVSSGGNAVGPRDTNSRMTPITVTSTNSHYAILQSKQYVRYIPAHGQRTFITGVFAAGANATASITRRTSTSGSVVDNTVSQSSWNQDKLDGTGKSGYNIDFTKIQILVIDAQMLYAGRIRVGFDIEGQLIWAHYFYIANVISTATMQTYNLPVRCEGRTGASSTSFSWGSFDENNGVFLTTTRTTTGGTAYFECCSVQSSGGTDMRGFPWGIGTSATARVGVTTRRAILSVRPKATFNSLTNRAHIELAEFSLTAKTNNSYYEIVVGGTLGGVPVWTSVSTDSCAEYDTAGTTVTGGVTIKSGRCLSGSGVTVQSAGGEIDLRNPLTLSKIDGLTATQPNISIVVTSESGTADMTGDINWHEQII